MKQATQITVTLEGDYRIKFNPKSGSSLIYLARTLENLQKRGYVKSIKKDF